MKFDLNQTGLRRLFSAWQVETMEGLWEHRKPMTSSDMYYYLKQQGVRTVRGKHGTVSRASVIIFLNELVDEGIATYTERTGKGGYHKVYSLAEAVKTREAFKRYITDKIFAAVKTFVEEE